MVVFRAVAGAVMFAAAAVFGLAMGAKTGNVGVAILMILAMMFAFSVPSFFADGL